MLAIHFGVRSEDVEAFTRLFLRDFPNLEVTTRSDNWNSWEPFDKEPQDTDILHVVVSTLTPMVLLNYMINRIGIFLNPLDDIESAFHGRFIVVTDHDHWNQYYVELSYPE